MTDTNSKTKVAAGVVIGALVGAAASYGATQLLNKSQQPGKAAAASSADVCLAGGPSGGSLETAPLFSIEGREYRMADLPAGVQNDLFEERSEAHSKFSNVLQSLALRVELARQKGMKVENPEEWDKLPELQDLVEKPAVSDEEAKKIFEQFKDRMPPGTTFEKSKDMIVQSLQRQQMGDVLRKHYEEFEKSGRFVMLVEPPAAPIANLDLAGFPSFGNAASPTKVAIVTDYFCSHCRHRAEEFKNVAKEFDKDAQVVFMTFPLQQEGLGHVLAKGDFCVMKQDASKYMAYRDEAEKIPFEASQATTPNKDEEFKNHALDVARKAGLEPKAFADCLASQESADFVKKTHDMLSKAGVRGTPTIFINNRKTLAGEGQLAATIRKAATPH